MVGQSVMTAYLNARIDLSFWLAICHAVEECAYKGEVRMSHMSANSVGDTHDTESVIMQVSYEDALTWRDEMTSSEVQYAGDMELCEGFHPLEGEMIIVTGSSGDDSFVIKPNRV